MWLSSQRAKYSMSLQFLVVSRLFFYLNHNINIDIDSTKSIAAELRCKTSSQKYWTLVSPTFLENSHNFYCGCEIQIYIFLWLQKFVTLWKENILLTPDMSKKVHQSCLCTWFSIDKVVSMKFRSIRKPKTEIYIKFMM